MQRSTNNPDFSIPLLRPALPCKQWKFTFPNDRSTRSARPTIFPRAEVLTKLQSLPFKSMRRNFHVKLPCITIDKISAIALGPYAPKFQSYNGFAFQRSDIKIQTYVFMFRDVCQLGLLFLCKIYFRFYNRNFTNWQKRSGTKTTWFSNLIFPPKFMSIPCQGLLSRLPREQRDFAISAGRLLSGDFGVDGKKEFFLSLQSIAQHS